MCVCVCSQVQLLSSDVSARSLSPISGYVSFPEGSVSASFSLASVDDLIPEPPERFVASLTNIVGGARLGGVANASIEVLKSDSSNGVFGISSPLTFPVLEEATGLLSVSVNRSAGTFGNVTVVWEVREVVSMAVARGDFTSPTGSVTFPDGVTEQRVLLSPLDEMVPELTEQFVLVLTTVFVNDDLISSSPFSSASIDQSRDTFTFSIAANDYPYGVLQFSSSATPPVSPFVVATSIPERLVKESAGVVTVYVERAQGLVGVVSVEYFTSDASATSLGLSPDYISSAGTLVFQDGVGVASFNVTLLDDDIPELNKNFYINLTNPLGGAVMGRGYGWG